MDLNLVIQYLRPTTGQYWDKWSNIFKSLYYKESQHLESLSDKAKELIDNVIEQMPRRGYQNVAYSDL